MPSLRAARDNEPVRAISTSSTILPGPTEVLGLEIDAQSDVQALKHGANVSANGHALKRRGVAARDDPIRRAMVTARRNDVALGLAGSQHYKCLELWPNAQRQPSRCVRRGRWMP